MTITKTLLAAAAVAGLYAPSLSAQTGHIGVSVNDLGNYDSAIPPQNSGGGQYHYDADTIVSDAIQGYIAGQPVAREAAARANFGNLGVSAFVASRSDGHGQPIVQQAVLAQAFWQDSFVFHRDGVADGTVVTVPFSAVIHVASEGRIAANWLTQYADSASCLDANTNFSATYFATGACSHGTSSGMAANFQLPGWQLVGADPGTYYAGYGVADTGFGIGYTTLNFTKQVTLGAPIDITAVFEAAASQYNPFTYLSGFGGSGFFAMGTAQSYFDTGALPGLTVTALSGHDYTVVPTELSGTVPEPAAWLMMITGFALIGAVMRGRRPRCWAEPLRA